MKKILLLAFFLLTWILPAQNQSEKIDLKQGSVAEKFDKLYSKSGKYKQYKVVEHGLLIELKKQVLDTLKKEKKQTADAKAKILVLQDKIAGLENEIKENQQQITALSSEKQNISLMGIDFTKEKFKLMVGILLLVLSIALLYFIYAYRNSNILTREAKKNLAKIEEEYYTFKTNALEREQLLKRQLLDEQKKHQ